MIRNKYFFLSPYRINNNKAKPEFVHNPANKEPRDIFPVENSSANTTVAAQFGMKPKILESTG